MLMDSLSERTMPEDKSEIRKRWESAAPGWAKWEHVLAVGFKDATESMLDMADVQPGMAVLDVACGAGSTSLQAAQRVGAGGRVVSSDISATMLDHVRENAMRLGVENIEILECAADNLGARSKIFDAAICRLGLMLFPDPVKSGAAIRNALKPKARFASLVFTTPPNNPFMSGPMQILLRHAGKELPPPGGPGIFALGAQGTLQAALEKSGYTEVSSDVVPVRLTLNSAKEALEMMRGAFGNYRTVVADLDEDARNTAWSEVGEYLEQFETNGGWQTELEVVIGSGMV
jgi:ubiquinone/menaquinone biosynthesis C-methylase UbiE